MPRQRTISELLTSGDAVVVTAARPEPTWKPRIGQYVRQRGSVLGQIEATRNRGQAFIIGGRLYWASDTEPMKPVEVWDHLWAQHAPRHLPPLVAEHRFHEKRKWRFDRAVPDVKLAIEIDGGVNLARGGRHGGDGDREKLNHAAVLGWYVLRFSTGMLEADGPACVALTVTTLERLLI